jgi:hypothetical protein
LGLASDTQAPRSDSTAKPDSAVQPQPGDTHVFQMIFRDKLNNLVPFASGALEVTFQ